MKPNILIAASALLCALPYASRANDCGSDDFCNTASCPQEFNNLIGVWHGHEQMELNSDLLSTEVQMIFADKACRASDDLVPAVVLVGRQTTVIPSGKNNAPRTDYKSVVIYSKKAREKSTSSNEANKLNYKLAELQLAVSEKKTTLKFPGREMEFQKLAVGQITHFAGKAWALTKEGKLIGVNNFLMESSYDPALNQIQQKLLYQGSKSSGGQLEVSLYDVVSEVYTGSRTDRRMASQNKSPGTKSDTMELLVDGKLYSEERFTIGNETASVVLFKAGEQITANEFQKRIEKHLQDQNSKVRMPATKSRP